MLSDHNDTLVQNSNEEIVLQCVAVCCSVLQCVAVCCSVLQCLTHWFKIVMKKLSNNRPLSDHTGSVVLRVAVCCSVLQCVAVCCSVLQCLQITDPYQIIPRT